MSSPTFYPTQGPSGENPIHWRPTIRRMTSSPNASIPILPRRFQPTSRSYRYPARFCPGPLKFCKSPNHL